MTDNRLLEAALFYHGLGFSILPVTGKKPTIKWEHLQEERASRKTVESWFQSEQRRTITGVAVVAGAVSGQLVVLDFDTMDGYIRWAVQNHTIASRVPTIRTSRGRHVLFLNPYVKKIKNLTGPEGDHEGELRGNGYSLLPPSIHPDGPIYTWQKAIGPYPLQFLDPYEWGLALRKDCDTEESEEPEDIEEIENIEEIKAIGGVYEGVESRIENAINTTLPYSEAQRNQCVFALARALKAIPEIRKSEMRTLKPIVLRWHTKALPVIRTKPFEDTWADFVYGWGKVKCPTGDVLGIALERVRASEVSQVSLRYAQEETRLLVSICRELQRVNGENPFFLSTRKAAELVGLDVRSAHRRLNLLEVDGVLKTEEKGSATTQKATRWRYVADDL